MEAIVERIVEKCIQSELIEESQRDWMAYSLQRKFMNFGGFFILVCFGTLVAPLPQVILLNFGLALLREKTNGLHMPTVLSCFITSYYIRVVFIDRSPAECYNKFRMLWIGMYHLPQRRF